MKITKKKKKKKKKKNEKKTILGGFFMFRFLGFLVLVFWCQPCFKAFV